jgi:predicted chitinase
MWFGQVGEESAGLRYMEELASGSEYEGRADLGNTQPGYGVRFKGRGPIQVTGRHNYTALSQWACDRGLVPTSTYFADNPEQLATDRYGFVGVTWYWTTQRPLNDAADARDIVRATRYVNGGTHGLQDRTDRWNHALAMGDAIVPAPARGLLIPGIEELYV